MYHRLSKRKINEVMVRMQENKKTDRQATGNHAGNHTGKTLKTPYRKPCRKNARDTSRETMQEKHYRHLAGNRTKALDCI